MENKIAMNLVSYEVDLFEFKKNNDYDFNSTTEIVINPTFTFEFFETEEVLNRYKITMGCSLFDGVNDYPFLCNVQISGVFDIIDIENKESLLKYNATAILLPYIRCLISQVTGMAGIQPVYLPILNVYDLVDSSVLSEK